MALAVGMAGPASAETLTEALSMAYMNNPELQAQRAALRATDENVPQAKSGYRPSLQGQGSISKSRQRNFFTGGQTTLTPRRFSLTLNQPVFQGFSTVNSVRQAKSEVMAGRAELTSVEQDTLLSAVTTYMNVLRDQAVLELNDNQVQVLRRQLEATQNRFEVGEVTRTDVAQAEARLAGAIADRTTAEAQLTASRTSYRRIMGQMPGTLEEPPALPQLPQSEQAALDLAVDNNPTLKAALRREEAAQYAADAASGELLPQVSLQASYSRNVETFTPGSDTRSKEIMAQVTIPFFQGGSTYSRIRQAKQRRSQRQLEIVATRRQLTEQVRNAWVQLQSARSTIEASQAQVDASEVALEGVRQEAQVGTRTTLDVLDAEQEFLNARVQLVRAERDEYVAGYTLLAAVGGLTATRLELNVEQYNPQEHYEEVDDQWLGWDSE